MEITTKELDDIALQLKTAIEQDKELDVLSKRSKGVVTSIKERMISILKEAKKTSYLAEGVGMCVVKTKMSVTTPKDIDSKKELFTWIKNQFGEDGFWNYMSINSATLNTMYNETLESSKEPELFNVPGIGMPTEYSTLSFTKR